MANNSRAGAVRKLKKGPTVGTGGHGRKALEGKGPTPKAEDRTYHKAHKNKQLSSALSFANALIEKGTNAKFKESVSFKSFSFFITNLTILKARKIKTVCERNPNDNIDIDYDQFADFEICAASFTPIYGGSPSVACPYDGSKYHSKYKGTVCKVCEVAEVGASAGGLRLLS